MYQYRIARQFFRITRHGLFYVASGGVLWRRPLEEIAYCFTLAGRSPAEVEHYRLDALRVVDDGMGDIERHDVEYYDALCMVVPSVRWLTREQYVEVMEFYRQAWSPHSEYPFPPEAFSAT